MLEIGDRTTVLRRGKKIETVSCAGATEESLARAMVGREVLLRVDKPPASPGEPLLEVEDLHVFDDRGIEKVRGVSLEVRAGEIVGIAGVDGNGQTELIDAITGLRKVAQRARSRSRAGTCAARAPAGCSTPASATSRRTASGAGSCSSSRSPRTSRCTTTREPPDVEVRLAVPEAARRAGAAADRRVRRARRRRRRRAPAASRAATSRRSSLAREIARDPKVLIAAQPTRGLDVGAIEYLHRRLVEERDEGRAILLISLELEEVLSLSDRILVIYEGEIVGEHTPDVTEQEIGLEMLGGARKGGGVSASRRPTRPRRRRAGAASRAPTAAARLAARPEAPAGSSCRVAHRARRVPDRRRSSSRATGPQPARHLPRHLQRRRA